MTDDELGRKGSEEKQQRLSLCPEGGNKVACFSHTGDRAICVSPSHAGSAPLKLHLSPAQLTGCPQKEPANKDKLDGGASQ